MMELTMFLPYCKSSLSMSEAIKINLILYHFHLLIINLSKNFLDKNC